MEMRKFNLHATQSQSNWIYFIVFVKFVGFKQRFVIHHFYRWLFLHWISPSVYVCVHVSLCACAVMLDPLLFSMHFINAFPFRNHPNWTREKRQGMLNHIRGHFSLMPSYNNIININNNSNNSNNNVHVKATNGSVQAQTHTNTIKCEKFVMRKRRRQHECRFWANVRP